MKRRVTTQYCLYAQRIMHFKNRFLKTKKTDSYLLLGLPGSGKSSLAKYLFNSQPLKKSVEFSQHEIGEIWYKEATYFVELHGKTLSLQEIEQIIPFVIDQYGPFKGVLVLLSGPEMAIEQEEGTGHVHLGPIDKILSLLTPCLTKDCALYLVISHLDQIAGFQSVLESERVKNAIKCLDIQIDPGKGEDCVKQCEAQFIEKRYALEASMLPCLQEISDLAEKRLWQQFPSRLYKVHQAIHQWLRGFNPRCDLTQSLTLRGIYHTGYSRREENSIFYDPIASQLAKAFKVKNTVLKALFKSYSSFLSTPNTSFTYCSGKRLATALFNDAVKLPQNRMMSSIVLLILTGMGTMLGVFKITEVYSHYSRVIASAVKVLNDQKRMISHNKESKNVLLITEPLQTVEGIRQSINQLQSLRGFPIQYVALRSELEKSYDKYLQSTVYPLIQSQIEAAFKTADHSTKILYRLLKLWAHLTDATSSKPKALIKELMMPIVSPMFSNVSEDPYPYLETFVHSETFTLMQKSVNTEETRKIVQKMRQKLLEQAEEHIILIKLEDYCEQLTRTFPFEDVPSLETYPIRPSYLQNLSCPAQYASKYFAMLYEEVIPALVNEFLQGKDGVLVEANLGIQDSKKFTETSRELIKKSRTSWLTHYADFWQKNCEQFTVVSMTNWKNLQSLFEFLKTYPFFFHDFSTVIVQHTRWEFLSKNLKQWTEQDKHLVQSLLSNKFYSYNTLLESHWMPSLKTLLHQLEKHLVPILVAQNPTQAAFDFLKRCFATPTASDFFEELFKNSSTLPKPLYRWMQGLLAQVEYRLFVDTKEHLNKTWQEEVFRFYAKHLEKKYPLFKDNMSDLSLEDFISFFGMQGKVIHYIDKYLLNFIDIHPVRWQLKTFRGKQVALAPSVLTELERAALIRDVFFGTNNVLNLTFKINGVNLPPRSKVFLLYRENRYVLQSPFSHPFVIHWPDLNTEKDQSNDIKIVLRDEQGKDNIYLFEGPWSWFRLLEQCSKNSDNLPIAFTLDSKLGPLTFQLWPEGTSEFGFKQGMLNRFRCPARIVV